MTIGPMSQCLSCKHRKGSVGEWPRDVPACVAYPAGIRDDIRYGRVDHRQPFRGDGGLRWTPRGDRKFPEHALRGSAARPDPPVDAQRAAELAARRKRRRQK